MTYRSLFLPGESYDDVMSALGKANTDEERRHIASERLKANGWSKEREETFRKHCAVVGFILGGSQPKANPLAQNPAGRTHARHLADAIANDFRQTKTLNGDMEE